MKPIRPDDVAEHKQKVIPEWVIQAFNEMITKHYVAGTSRFKQKDVVQRILTLCPNEGMTAQMLFDEHYLDVEEMYRASGWKVYYDKPGYNETYDPMFEFSAKPYPPSSE